MYWIMILSKKIMYDKLVTKVNAINNKTTSNTGLVTKTHDDLDKQRLETIEEIRKRYLTLVGWLKSLITKNKL